VPEFPRLIGNDEIELRPAGQVRITTDFAHWAGTSSFINPKFGDYTWRDLGWLIHVE
jgi:hypothetical protein